MKETILKSENEVLSFIELYSDSYIDKMEIKRTEKEEHKLFIRYFKHFWKDIIIEYPISIIFRDSPDCEIKLQKSIIGIEITKAIPEQLAEAENIRQNYNLGSIIEPGLFRVGSQNLTRNEVIQCI